MVSACLFMPLLPTQIVKNAKAALQMCVRGQLALRISASSSLPTVNQDDANYDIGYA